MLIIDRIDQLNNFDRVILRKLMLVTSVLGFGFYSFSQNGVGIGTNNPDPAAILDVYSTTHGLLIPRMTTEERANLTNNLTASSSTADGLIVYDTDQNMFYFWDEDNTIWLSANPWNYRAPDNSSTTPAYDVYLNPTTSVGIGRTNPEEKLHVQGNIKASGNVNANSITGSSFSGNGSGLTNVNSALLQGNPASYFGTATDVAAKLDASDLFINSSAVSVSVSDYCGFNYFTINSSSIEKQQVGNILYVTGRVNFDVTSTALARTCVAIRLAGVPDFEPFGNSNFAYAQLSFRANSTTNYVPGSVQVLNSSGNNLITFRRQDGNNFSIHNWTAVFQFFYFTD